MCSSLSASQVLKRSHLVCNWARVERHVSMAMANINKAGNKLSSTAAPNLRFVDSPR